MEEYEESLNYICIVHQQNRIISSFIDTQENLKRYEIGTANSDTKFHSRTVLLSNNAAPAGSAEPKRSADRVIIARTGKKENHTTHEHNFSQKICIKFTLFLIYRV